MDPTAPPDLAPCAQCSRHGVVGAPCPVCGALIGSAAPAPPAALDPRAGVFVLYGAPPRAVPPPPARAIVVRRRASAALGVVALAVALAVVLCWWLLR